MTQDEFLRALQSGNIPRREGENLEQYMGSQEVSAYGARPPLAPGFTMPPNPHPYPAQFRQRDPNWAAATIPWNAQTQANVNQPPPVIQDPCTNPAGVPCQPGAPGGMGYEAFGHLLRNIQQHAKPPGYQAPPFHSFWLQLQTPVPLNITDLAQTTILQYTCPQGKAAVFVRLGMALESVAAFLDTSWRVTIDGTPLPGLNQMNFQYGHLDNANEVSIKVEPGKTLRVQAIGLTATIIHYGRAMLNGWVLDIMRPYSIGSYQSFIGD